MDNKLEKDIPFEQDRLLLRAALTDLGRMKN
jgi:hypothetical protein